MDWENGLCGNVLLGPVRRYGGGFGTNGDGGATDTEHGSHAVGGAEYQEIEET